MFVHSNEKIKIKTYFYVYVYFLIIKKKKSMRNSSLPNLSSILQGTQTWKARVP